MNVSHVLHVVPHLDRVGGYERQALALARHQRRTPSMAPILLTHADGTQPLVEDDSALDVHRLPRGLLRHHPGAWWRRHGAGVDLVHAHGMHKLTGQVVALAARVGVPSLVKVATEDDVRMFADPGSWSQLLDGDESAPRGLRWRTMATTTYRRLRRAGIFVALNASIERQLSEHGLRAVRVPNGVDTEHFRPPTDDERRAARTACGAGPDEPVIAYVGRLATRKDVASLVAAFARLVADDGRARNAADRDDDARPARATRGADAPPRLLVAGDGPLRGALEGLLAASGCAGRATFLGECADVRPALWAADVFVHPSRREGLPNTLLEAWACGVAAVLSDIPGHREAVAWDGGNGGQAEDASPAARAGDAHAGPGRADRERAGHADGESALFFAPGDVDGIVHAMRRLLGDARRRRTVAEAGLARVRRVFTLDRVAATYARIYAELQRRPQS